MTITTDPPSGPRSGPGAAPFTGHVTANGVDIWVDQRGDGPDVLLLAGLSDPAEAWTFQLEGLADRYRMTAFDNRGAGRSPMPPDGFSVADLADDAAAVLRALGISAAHVAGFSGGSATAQELALRHPDLVRSLVLVSTWARPDAYFDQMVDTWTWMAEVAPSERAMLEAFFLWIYTAGAHEEGLVGAIIDEALEFPFPQSPEGFHRQLTAWRAHDTFDRLPRIAVPTMVVAGAEDRATPPRLGRIVADRIPGAQYVELAGEAHQPFQEQAEMFNDLVDAFWTEIDRGR
jgi:pimeloyl-ACP methyl ester carboxylesterase